MNERWKQLLARHPDVDADRIMQYLQQETGPGEMREIEKGMADSPFLSDAMEGLLSVKESGDLKGIMTQINSDLNRQIQKRRRRKRLKAIGFPGWILLALLVVILAMVAGYALYNLLLGE